MDRPKPIPRNPRNPTNKNTRNRRRRHRDRAHDLEEEDEGEEEVEILQQEQESSSGGPTSPIIPPEQSQPPPITKRRGDFIRERTKTLDPSPHPQPSTSTGGGGSDHLRRQIDRLERDLQRRDRELEEERGETEKCLETINKLERDKVDLKREMDGLRDEAEDYRNALEEYRDRLKRKDEGSSEGEGENANFAREGGDISIQQKNKEIQELLEDNERLEDDKRSLEEKLEELRDSLSEATRQMESMTGEHFTFKSKMKDSEEKIKGLEEEKAVLMIRERELLGYKERHDQYLENLCNAVDIRVDVWKKIMFDKDEEIERLNSKISSLMSQIPNTQLDSDRMTIQSLTKKMAERDHQISLLQDKLSQATEELESSSKLIEALQSKLNLTQDPKKTDNLLTSLQSRVKHLEDKIERRNRQLAEVEREAEEKSRTLTSLMARMTSYESGQYGLPEAVSEIKDLKTQIRIRDKQIEGSTQELNVVNMQISDLQEENEMLRVKLGLEPEADVSRETRRYTRNRKNELSALRGKVVQLEEEVVTLKTKNYSMKKQLQQYHQQLLSGQVENGPYPDRSLRLGPEGGSTSTSSPKMTKKGKNIDATDHHDHHGAREALGPQHPRVGPDFQEKYEIILEENSTLRKGLHEILECMQKLTDEGTSEILIQAPILEDLLREMSARGIINYPFPLTSFHMKVCTLEGKCSQLREELHRLRGEERKLREELFQAQKTIEKLQEEKDIDPSGSGRRRRVSSTTSQGKDKHVTFTKDQEDPSSIIDDDGQSTEIFLQPRRPSASSTLSLSGVMSPIPTGRNLVFEALQEELESLRQENEALKDRMAKEHSEALENLMEIQQKAEELLRAGSSHDHEEGANRDDSNLKIQYLEAIKENERNEVAGLLRRLCDLENRNNARLSFLERFRIKALHQIGSLQGVLETSVSIHLLHNARKEIRMLTGRVEELEDKEEGDTLRAMAYHKGAEELKELREERDMLEEELGKVQARLLETAVGHSETTENGSQGRSETPTKGQNEISGSLALFSLMKSNASLKSQLTELESSKSHLEQEVHALNSRLKEALLSLDVLKDKLVSTINRKEYDLLQTKLRETEESLVLQRDEALKWKEIAEMTQTQIRAVENIQHFDKLEVDYLSKLLMDLQSESEEKSLLVRAHHHLLTADKEKHLAIQQVEKLLSKLAQMEAQNLQQSRVHQEREMSLILMHSHVIMRYRTLFAALHESQSPGAQPRVKFAVGGGGATLDLKEAFQIFEKTQKKCSALEDQLLEERLKVEELEEKCRILEIAAQEGGTGQELVFESLQRVQELRLELSKWKRKAELKGRESLSLKESLGRLESKTSELEDDRVRLEHTALELKESLASTLIKGGDPSSMSIPSVIHPVQTISSQSMPRLVSSTVLKEDKGTQVVEESLALTSGREETSQERPFELVQVLENMKMRVAELEGTLQAKEDALHEIRVIKANQENRGTSVSSLTSDAELQETIMVARETINSLQERLRSKEDSVTQYRRLLAEVRTEMTSETERHVQEMRALQMTIHQQQQAFTRMKSTLTHPVKDTAGIEGTIKDQITRIHELEEEVSDLQHAMSNTAAQLTAARSEVHRWRCLAEAKVKEADIARDQSQTSLEQGEELTSVRQELRDTKRQLEEAKDQITSLRSAAARESMTDLVNVLRAELEEKDKQIEAYSKSLHNLRTSSTYTEKGSLEERLRERETEITLLKEENKELHKTIASQQVKLSKTKALNYHKGITPELEELRLKHKQLLDDKDNLSKQLEALNKKRDEEELRKIRSAETVSRWEESKKWKGKVEKADLKIKELEAEIERSKVTCQNLRVMVQRAEKERNILEGKLSRGTSSRATSATSGGTYHPLALPQGQGQGSPSSDDLIRAQGTIADLTLQIQDLKDLQEKTEFEGHEEVEKLRMEIKILKDRVIGQERQLTAYEIATRNIKGDDNTRVIKELEKMGEREGQLQKEIRRLEEDNLRLNLQIEQLRLESPRLRDRVQHLQKLVEALKTEKSSLIETNAQGNRKKSQRSLGELERTIQALRDVIDKLQDENSKLAKKGSPLKVGVGGDNKLKKSIDKLMEEQKSMMDRIHYLEHENEKVTRKLVEGSTLKDGLEDRLKDSERRAESAEMKLRTLLDIQRPSGPSQSQSHHQDPSCSSSDSLHPPTPAGSTYTLLMDKMREMQAELETKTRLLNTAKQSLRAAEKATAPKPVQSPRGGGGVASGISSSNQHQERNEPE